MTKTSSTSASHAAGSAAPSEPEPNLATLVSLLQDLPNAILVFDRDWRITYANAEAQRISHLTPADLHNKTHWELFPETIGTPLEAFYREVMATGVPGRTEYYHAPFDTWIDLHVIPTDDGIALHYSGITSRKRAEEARDLSLNRLQQVFDASPNTIVCIDRDWNCTFFNRAARSLIRRDDPTGANLWVRFPFSQQEPFASNCRRTMEQRIPTEFEVFYPEPLNIWLGVWARPYEDGIIVFTSDISSRKRAEARRDAVTSQLQQVFEAITDGVISLSWDWTITFLNQRAIDIFDRHDLLGKNLWEEFPVAMDTAFYTRYHQTMEQRTPCEFEEFYPEPLNLWLSIQCRPSDDGMVVFFRDITAERNARQDLRQKQIETERQRAELETVYRTAPIGLALFDPVEFRFLRLNDRQAEIVGLPPEQILDRPLTEITPIPGLHEIFKQVATGHSIQGSLLEGEIPSRPGEHRYWNVNCFPVYAPDGSVQAISAASLEITHQKKAELALIQSEKLAAVGRLASSISHEINNPLEAITNLLFLISLDEKLPEAVKGYVHTAQSELGRVSQIVTQTLRFHRQAIKPTSVTAAELVDAVLNLYQGRLINSGIDVQVKYVTATRILCFENDIRQVLNNLIANAIDAMRGGGHLLIRAHDATHRDPETGRARKGVRITIADTGHGMSPEIRARIFEPFYTTKDLNGTGLGLWISEGIISHHHGILTLRSTQSPKHHGTIFSLFLPCEEQPT